MNKYVTLDMNVISAIGVYILYGLDPGSFAEANLLIDYDLSFQRAHHNLKTIYEGEDIVQNHIEFVKNFVPEICYGSKEKIAAWKRHRGLKYLSPDLISIFNGDVLAIYLKTNSMEWWNKYKSNE